MSNFDFLKEKFPVLANLGNLAEKYLYTDPNSCLIKLGMIGETVVNLIFEYDNIKNTNNRNQDTFYEVVNSSLRFQRKNSPFEFEFRANNLFDVRKKNTYSFSDYIISQQNTYILPRILLFSISYKL